MWGVGSSRPSTNPPPLKWLNLCSYVFLAYTSHFQRVLSVCDLAAVYFAMNHLNPVSHSSLMVLLPQSTHCMLSPTFPSKLQGPQNSWGSRKTLLQEVTGKHHPSELIDHLTKYLVSSSILNSVFHWCCYSYLHWIRIVLESPTHNWELLEVNTIQIHTATILILPSWTTFLICTSQQNGSSDIKNLNL